MELCRVNLTKCFKFQLKTDVKKIKTLIKGLPAQIRFQKPFLKKTLLTKFAAQKCGSYSDKSSNTPWP